MDIDIRRIYRKIYLSDYFGDDGEDVIEVWGNPPRAIRSEWAEIRVESEQVTEDLVALSKRSEESSESERNDLANRLIEANNRFYEWFAKVWRFDGRELTTEEIREFATKCEKEDEALWVWLITSTWRIINNQRDLVKKG
jgi:hypothetical protein